MSARFIVMVESFEPERLGRFACVRTLVRSGLVQPDRERRDGTAALSRAQAQEPPSSPGRR